MWRPLNCPVCRYGLDYKLCPWVPGVYPEWVEWSTDGGNTRPKCAWKAIKLPDHRNLFPWPELVGMQRTIHEEGFEEPVDCPECDPNAPWIVDTDEEDEDEDEPDLVENDKVAVVDGELEGTGVALMGITDGKYLPN